MKRLHRSNTRQFSHVALIGIVILSISSCDLFSYKRPFADAYYENNFIASTGFDNFVTTPGTDSLNPPTGQWDFAYRYDGWDGVEYMTLGPETDAAYSTAGGSGYAGTLPVGLVSTSPVYRLELINMITGGDFETGPGTWALASVESKRYWINSGGINNYTILLNLRAIDTNQYTLSALPGMMLPGREYNADFRWGGDPPNLTSADSYIRMNDETGSSFLFNTNTNHATVQFTSASTGNNLVFHTAWEGLIDDVTVRKVARHQLRLLLLPGETNPPLEEFQYIFSFWVHADPLVTAASSPYHLDRLGIKMSETAVSTVTTKSDPDYTYAPDAGWRKLSVKVDNGNLQVRDDAAGAVLELIVDLDNSLPGRILITQPELRAYPDGY